MSKIISEELYEREPNKFDVFRAYGKVNQKIIEFKNKGKLSTFIYLFGDEEGVRLCRHFVEDCNKDYNKFRTYLTVEQSNDLLVNIYYNEFLYIM